jgi:hypothetical protein
MADYSIIDYAIPSVNIPTDLADDLVLKFDIPSARGQMLDPSQVYLSTKVRIVHSDGTFVTDDAQVALTSGFGITMISRLDIYNQSQRVASYPNYGSTIYPLRIWLEPKSYINDVESQAGGFCPDGPGVDPSVANEGFITRQALASNSKLVCMYQHLNVPCWNQNEMIPRESSWAVHLFVNNLGYNLQGDKSLRGKYKIRLEAAKLVFTSVVLLTPAYQNLLRSRVLSTRFLDIRTDTFLVLRGAERWRSPTVTIPVRPVSVLLFLVDETGARGAIEQTPFYYENCDISKIDFKMGGTSHLYSDMNFSSDSSSVAAFYSTIRALRRFDGDLVFDYDLWSAISTVFAFNVDKGRVGVDEDEDNSKPSSYSVDITFNTRSDRNMVLYVILNYHNDLNYDMSSGVAHCSF